MSLSSYNQRLINRVKEHLEPVTQLTREVIALTQGVTLPEHKFIGPEEVERMYSTRSTPAISLIERTPETAFITPTQQVFHEGPKEMNFGPPGEQITVGEKNVVESVKSNPLLAVGLAVGGFLVIKKILK